MGCIVLGPLLHEANWHKHAVVPFPFCVPLHRRQDVLKATNLHYWLLICGSKHLVGICRDLGFVRVNAPLESFQLCFVGLVCLLRDFQRLLSVMQGALVLRGLLASESQVLVPPVGLRCGHGQVQVGLAQEQWHVGRVYRRAHRQPLCLKHGHPRETTYWHPVLLVQSHRIVDLLGIRHEAEHGAFRQVISPRFRHQLIDVIHGDLINLDFPGYARVDCVHRLKQMVCGFFVEVEEHEALIVSTVQLAEHDLVLVISHDVHPNS
mmetsp:Transcript_6795/g.19616  ORF Transcript_6795/g.19616 Transcript_6795/m.19616 type:complete len:264 (+) Transcript_6795:1735-2526(+)